MSVNDRAREAADALRKGARFDFPEVRTLILAVLDDAADGTRFPEGIREAIVKIEATYRAEHDHRFEPAEWSRFEFCECGEHRAKENEG